MILALLTLLLNNFVFVQSQTLDFPSSNLPPQIECGATFFECILFFFDKFLRVIIVLALALATIFIAWAGILYIVKGSDEKKVAQIHKITMWATIGFIIAFMSYAFIRFIEGALRQPERIFLPINIVFAQGSEKISPPPVPTELRCGPVVLPSVLESTVISQSDVWKICILYFIERGLSALYRISLFLGVIFLSWAGILYIIKSVEEKDLAKIHQKIIFGIVGVIISIMSFTIVKMIELFFTRLGR